jgi:hypothetical protein
MVWDAGEPLASRSRAQVGSDAQPTSLIQCVGCHPDHERDPNIPDRECASHERHEPFAFVQAEVAGPEGKLRAGQKQYDAQDGGREEPKQRPDRAAEEQCCYEQQAAKYHNRAASSGTEPDMTGHATCTMAHRNTANTGTQQVHQPG